MAQAQNAYTANFSEKELKLEHPDRDRVKRLRPQLAASRQLATLGWSALLAAAEGGKLDPVLTEASYRRLQLGWID